MPTGKERTKFDPADEVDASINRAQSDFEKALVKMGVLRNKEAIPILADYDAVYRQKLNAVQMAHEIGISAAEFVARSNSDNLLRKLTGLGEGDSAESLSFDRFIFEKNFCAIAERFEQGKGDGNLVTTTERRAIQFTYFETVDGKTVLRTGTKYVDLPAFK